MAELLSLHRAARRIGVTSKWLRAEADAKRIPCLQADSRYLFDIDAVTRELSRRAVICQLDAEMPKAEVLGVSRTV